MTVAPQPSLAARVAPLLPLLRRYARALAGSQDAGDARVEAVLAGLLADPAGVAARMDAIGEDRVALYAAFEALAPRDEPGGAAAGRHERAAADRLRGLAPLQQKALLLTALEGFTEAQAAQILDIAPPELRGLAVAARSALRSLGAARIVIIEDEPIIAADIEAIVADLGHSVVARAANRTEGVAAALAHRPDLVLADIRLADGSSGVDAVRDILAAFEVPAIFITAYPERLLTGVRPEPTFLVVKPFRAAAVQAAVARAVLPLLARTRLKAPSMAPQIEPRGGSSLTGAGVWVIAAIAITGALDYASAIAIPTVLAALAAIALAPLARRLEAARLPASLAAGLIVAGALGGAAATLYALAPSAEAWSQRAPVVIRTLEIRARAISGDIARSLGVEPAPPPIRDAGPEGPVENAEEQDAVGKLVEGGEALITDLAISAPRFVGGAVYWAALTFFMLRDRAALARRVLTFGPSSPARRALGRAMRDVQLDVSRYLLTITLINIGLGLSVSAAFAALGVPNAALWGVAAGLLNYMPFVGAAAMALVTLGVGIVSFAEPMVAFAPVAVILTLNTIEGQVVTPLLIGARMRLSTVGVFVAIAFGAWLWGAAGALLATPTLIVAGAFFNRLDLFRSRPPRKREGGDQRRQRRERPAGAGQRAQG